jgi:hypothetical protein
MIICLASLLAISSSVAAQEIAPFNPPAPSQVVGPQLIAWSELQTPRPLSSEKPSQRFWESQDSQNQQGPSAQVFTGTIVKDESRYVLRAADGASYQLDDQEKAKRYEGKQVKIIGSIDAHGTTLHVTSIELLS